MKRKLCNDFVKALITYHIITASVYMLRLSIILGEHVCEVIKNHKKGEDV